MTLLAAFKTLLYRITGQADLVVGVPVAGRTRPETERLIGSSVKHARGPDRPFGRPHVSRVLRRVRETALEAFVHQELPFERLVEEVQPQRDPGRTPIFQVMFALQNAPAPTLELPGLSVETFASAHVAAKFDGLSPSTRETTGFTSCWSTPPISSRAPRSTGRWVNSCV